MRSGCFGAAGTHSLDKIVVFPPLPAGEGHGRAVEIQFVSAYGEDAALLRNVDFVVVHVVGVCFIHAFLDIVAAADLWEFFGKVVPMAVVGDVVVIAQCVLRHEVVGFAGVVTIAGGQFADVPFAAE